MSLTFNELPVYFTVSAEASYDLRSTNAAVRDAAHSIHSSSYTEIVIRTGMSRHRILGDNMRITEQSHIRYAEAHAHFKTHSTYLNDGKYLATRTIDEVYSLSDRSV
jgi:hypothetical protein